ncbi:hypothetical protein BUALT_Bualt07G0051500 [Buddleja alternifolia]|uniref:DDT domain-containing protein n=1 Tax=Buddleja alternifolia TaxID=168488 RepID=A0AAV6XCM5_9LAMI|nr:hypothetical protein BUALT_Bualt07G0051500 [Buddleja alternifolia]
MQALDLPCNPSLDPPAPDPSAMSEHSSPIHSPDHHSSKNPENTKTRVEINSKNENIEESSVKNSSVSKNNGSSSSVMVRRERPSRACTQRAAARLQAAAEAEAAMAERERKRKITRKRERLAARLLKEESEDEEDGFSGNEEGVKEENGEEDGSPSSSRLQCGKIITPLVGELEPSQLPRWNIRSMWQLASIFNFLNVFRPLLNIKVEFSAEEFETALISPNNTLGDVHMPLLKAIPPVTRMALGHGTWITVLCRKLRDWWHWVAEGDLPIVASHGAEVEAYNSLDPGVRVVILKALCDIRVEVSILLNDIVLQSFVNYIFQGKTSFFVILDINFLPIPVYATGYHMLTWSNLFGFPLPCGWPILQQEDIRNYIDESIKHGVHLSAFRKERIGGDSHGISYWYEDDPIIGHRLYREIRKVEVKKGKGKTVPPIPHSSYQWETVATNLDEFLNVSEKLFASKNRIEVAVGKKLKNDMLPEIEKRKEKLLKKQHRQALMLDGMLNMDGLATGRSLRDRKPVTYTFDDYDRSINEALKVTKKKQTSPEPFERRDPRVKLEVSANGRWGGPSQYSRHDSFSALSPESLDNDEFFDDQKTEALDRSNRRRQRPERYSVKEFVEAVSDNDADFDSDDDIVGEVVYDDEYLRKRKERRKTSSSSEGDGEGEGDEEYNWDEENPEEEEEEEEDDNESLSTSEESGGPRPRRYKAMSGRTRRGTKLRSVDELQSGLRRSKRATRNRINYRQYEMSESEPESMKPEKSSNAALDEHYEESDNNDDDNNNNNNEEFSPVSQDSEEKNDKQDMDVDQPTEEMNHLEMVDDKKETDPTEESNSGNQEVDGVRKRRFLDLNELAPGSGFDDGPGSMRDEDGDEF